VVDVKDKRVCVCIERFRIQMIHLLLGISLTCGVRIHKNPYNVLTGAGDDGLGAEVWFDEVLQLAVGIKDLVSGAKRSSLVVFFIGQATHFKLIGFCASRRWKGLHAEVYNL
jgi:hypothetical protein